MPKPVVAFVVNGGPESAMGIRAQSFAARLDQSYSVHVYYRTGSKIGSIFRFLAALRALRPDACYVLDLAYSGVVAALLAKALFRTPVVTDTGDAILALARAMGRHPAGLVMTAALEYAGLRWSDRVVVRSHYHAELLEAKGISATVVPDGVDLQRFQANNVAFLRSRYGLEQCVTIGTLGSLTFNHRTGQCYGMEILHVVACLSDKNVRGVIIGDGSGLSVLKHKAAELGIEERILFLGRQPYDELPQMLALIDICVSTQTNDLPGRVRTTGKLPLYLATNRFVLATSVGEASRVLPPAMLVPYHGSVDEEFPDRLASAVTGVIEAGIPPSQTREIAARHFDYDVLAARVEQMLAELTSHASSRASE